MTIAFSSTACDVTVPFVPHPALVFDSPHSWRSPPMGVRVAAPEAALLTSWDAFVDELFGHAPAAGATLISARFPRWLIDVNRARDDIDVGMIQGTWPLQAHPTHKSRVGMGVLRRYALPGVSVHEAAIPVLTVQNWLNDFYDPYHHELRHHLDAAHRAHSAVWHVNCHSMKSVGNAMNADNGARRVDFVISNNDGKTSSSDFLHTVADLLKVRGFSVGINDPYKGAHLIDAYSDPAMNRHSIQIEVNRSLYMNEKEFEKNDHFCSLQTTLSSVIDELSAYVRAQL